MPPAAPQGGGGAGPDQGSTAIIWAIVAIFVILGLIWYVFKIQIITGYLSLKIWELNVIGFFARSSSIAGLKNLLQSLNPAVLNFEDLVSMGQLVGA
ncbi:MAG TPA: hypothetical protein VHA13_02445, partial [Gammaproteobacteria bacterium]|nr:hypothetical protein [Gammaproteobacteria bacterium]